MGRIGAVWKCEFKGHTLMPQRLETAKTAKKTENSVFGSSSACLGVAHSFVYHL